MSKVLVTGGKGQLAQCIKDAAINLQEFRFFFKNSKEFDITNKNQVDTFFEKEKPQFCINCAAYTQVDKAELEVEKAKSVNTEGARNLAEACAKYNVKLIHISTDFVFDGKAISPYTEEDRKSPLNVYGQTKLDGELAIEALLKEHFIIRTSWLYSEYGHNFMKTMLRLGSEKKQIKVVSDQVGTPTYAGDLADIIVGLLEKNTERYGTYHFSNQGSTTWFGFAKKIVALGAIKGQLLPITTEDYPTLAIRPAYSVLNTDKIKNALNLNIPQWQDGLEKCFKKLDAQ